MGKETLFSIPEGAIIDGRILTQRELHPAIAVTIGEAQHPPGIFQWPLDDLNAIGILAFVDDEIPEGYQPGREVDLQEPGTIHRTYPNAYFDVYAAKANRKAEIFEALSELDVRRIRPLAEGDVAFLANLNAQVLALRGELKTLDEIPAAE